MDIGLQVSADKTKYFTNGIDFSQPLAIYGIPVGNIGSFNYLGSSILPDGRAFDEIETRINKARVLSYSFRKLHGNVMKLVFVL